MAVPHVLHSHAAIGKERGKAVGSIVQVSTTGSTLEILSPNIYACPANSSGTSWQSFIPFVVAALQGTVFPKVSGVTAE